MKKIAIGFGILILLLVVVKTTGVLVNYTLPTTSNEPTLKLNSHFLTTNMKSPQIGDFITFKPPLPSNGDEIFVKRLCGVAGDTIQMIGGVCYLNGVNIDSNLALQHSFIVDENSYKAIKSKYTVSNHELPNNMGVEVMLTDDIAKEFGVLDKKSIHRVPNQGPPIFPDLDQPQHWTRDNFGPIVIPSGKAFAMGDNRHYSYDCRFFGFLDQDKISGVVIWK